MDTAISGNGLQNYTRGWVAGGMSSSIRCDLVVQQALSPGQGAIYRLHTPRTFILTNVFTF